MTDYSFIINLRIRRESERERKLLELAEEYGIDVGCKLIDRILDDRYDILTDRARRIEELAREERELLEKRGQIYGGVKKSKKPYKERGQDQ